MMYGGNCRVYSSKVDKGELLSMVFSWFRDLHRSTIAEQPFPEEWEAILQRHFAHFVLLTPDEQQHLRQDIQIFIAEKVFEGCGGLELTTEMQVLVAAQACLLTLHREHEFYPNVESILIYPSGYSVPQKSLEPGGIVHETMSERLGEAWDNGPVVLSWMDVEGGAANDRDGQNVVYHEFAHKLDMRDGAADGVPRLEDDAQYDKWAAVMSREYQELVTQTQAGQATLLGDYAATNAAEFFAVGTECFFEKPLKMQQTHPSLYAALRDFYLQDPAARQEAQLNQQASSTPTAPHVHGSNLHGHI